MHPMARVRRWLAAIVLACAGNADVQAAGVPGAVLTGLLPYIEQQYAAAFPGPQVDRRSGAYTYRYYPTTGNYVGYDGVDLYAMGPVVGSTVPVKVMSIIAWCDANPASCAVTADREVLVGGVTRQYLVYASWKALKTPNAPLVVMVHGSNQTGRYAYQNFGWKEVADAEGLVVAYPTGLNYCYFEDKDHDGRVTPGLGGDVRQVETKWANGELGLAGVAPLCTENQQIGLDEATKQSLQSAPADDDGFMRAMVAAASAEWATDPKRIYATGFSNGGAYVHHLAGAMADLFAAVHVHSGVTLDAPVSRASRVIPLLFTDGAVTDVGTVPIDVDVYAAGNTIGRYAAALASVNGTSTATHGFVGSLRVPGTGLDVGVYTFPEPGRVAAPISSFSMVFLAGLTHRYPDYLAGPVWSLFLKNQRLP